jgi:hypothetical protein
LNIRSSANEILAGVKASKSGASILKRGYYSAGTCIWKLTAGAVLESFVARLGFARIIDRELHEYTASAVFHDRDCTVRESGDGCDERKSGENQSFDER